jgi:hypothetical protein
MKIMAVQIVSAVMGSVFALSFFHLYQQARRI